MKKYYLVGFILAAILFGNYKPVLAADLSNTLKGYILLQVEANGEAWYVNPSDGIRYYMKDGNTAYQMMRNFGLGVTNEDLKKIPIGIDFRFNDSNPQTDQDGDGMSDKLEEAIGTNITIADNDGDGHDDGREVLYGYDPLNASPIKLSVDSSLISRLKGKILLQVENKGQAWYVNPSDGKRYYMTDGNMAYQMMRYLALGITNLDLKKIPAKEVTEMKFYSNEVYGISFWYPLDYTIVKDGIYIKYVDHPQGYNWYQIELKNLSDPSWPALVIEVDPDGYGPFFPDKEYLISQKDNHLNIDSETIIPNERKIDAVTLITTNVLQASNGHSYFFRFGYDGINVDSAEQQFKKIITSVKFE